MLYYTKIRGNEGVKRVMQSEARRLLEGYWKEDFLDEIFAGRKAFRLWTRYSEVWSKDENGNTLADGVYGVAK